MTINDAVKRGKDLAAGKPVGKKTKGKGPVPPKETSSKKKK